jgi:hypothetical protein
MAAQQPLLRDVIAIKENISTSDFVLRLADATTPTGAAGALRDYVVTERLLKNFDEALGLIKSALDGNTSKAAYLHGSFGSGKSHFMAVLYALLSGNPAARSRPEFDPVLTKHDWLGADGKKFLLVPYHMLGSKALEQRVLGGYVSHIKRLHPEAAVPQVYRTDSLFADVRAMRANMGDEAVLRGLVGGNGSARGADASSPAAAEQEDEWGDGFAWTSELLDTALDAEESHGPEDKLNLLNPTTPKELRAKLVNDASSTLLPGFAQSATEDEHGFISLDAGLTVIAAHAKSLGYHGLILFMDELILWLATLIHDQKFVAREASKITNFVEGGDARRAIPIVSFIARQRDLRELVGEEVSGAAEASIQDTLNLASGRFDKITLEDRNLPQIAHARLLKPKSPELDKLVDEAFAQTRRLGPQVWDTLLGSEKGAAGADEESFRLTYPFSPAFMDTLVHISSALQRSRTGLKLMSELLSAHRNELRLGDLVPVGDLYPVIAQGGDKPFVDSLKVMFDAADKLYKTKLRPYLLRSCNITEDEVEQYTHRPESLTDTATAARCKLFVGDNRLICTLLLSALAPSVPALADLTLRRLAALNHGSVVAPIPGSEVGVLKKKVAEWASRFPEIKETGTDANPVVRLELSGVDVDSVIANAAVNDNPGNRTALAMRLLAEEFGVQQGKFTDEVPLTWRGSTRVVEVVFGNIADEDELPDHELVPQSEGLWRIVVDLPFDNGDYGPVDDANRIRRLRDRQQGVRSRTLAWVPSHLSAQRFADFRLLVIIDKALADDQRFATHYAAHLNADNRARAKGLLETQRAALLRQVKAAFKQAYGLAKKQDTDVVDFDDHLQPLPDIDDLNLPFALSLGEAVRHLAGKLLAHQYPAHPDLDPDRTGTAMKPADARRVFAHIRAAAEARERRVEIPSTDRRLMKRLAEQLGLGRQKEVYFELSTRWADHFRQLASSQGLTGDLSVITLSEWTGRPEPRGLEDFLAKLIIAAFAEIDDRVWVRGGVPLVPAPDLGQIRDHDALRSQPLPAEAAWEDARRRFETIFGQKAPTLLRGRMVNQFAHQIIDQARTCQEHAADLVRELEKHANFLGLDENDETGRLMIARRAFDLLKGLTAGSGLGTSGAKKTIEMLASVDLGTVSTDRYGASIAQAQSVAQALATQSWATLELAENQGAEGRALLDSLRGVARGDQRTADLREALKRTTTEVLALVKSSQRVTATPTSTPATSPLGPDDVTLSGTGNVPPSPGPPISKPSAQNAVKIRRSGGGRTTAARAAAELAELATLDPGATIEITWRVVD